MIKARYILLAILLFVGVYLVAPLFDKSANKVRHVGMVELNQPNSVPLTWLGGNTILIGRNDEIFTFDVAKDSVALQSVATYDSTRDRQNCFSKDGAILAIKPPANTNKNDATSSKKPRYNYVRIYNWNQRENTVQLDVAEWWNTNPLDCNVFDFEKRKRNASLRAKEASYMEGAPAQSRPLFKTLHGDAWVYIKKEATNVFGKYVEVTNLTEASAPSQNAHWHVKLETKGLDLGIEQFPKNIESYFDESAGNYLIYETSDKFDARRNEWPLAAWRVSPDLKILARYALPPGPWVKNESGMKTLSCFSCGCECYSHFYLRGANGKIYAHVYGKAVDDPIAGIFLLEESGGKSEWSRIYSGNFSDRIIVSPDGCTVVFADQSRKLKKLNVCVGGGS